MAPIRTSTPKSSSSPTSRFDSSRLSEIIQTKVLLSTRSDDVWEWPTPGVPCGDCSQEAPISREAIQASLRTDLAWECESPEKADLALLESYLVRHREKLLAIVESLQQGSEESGADGKGRSLWMDPTGRRMAHKVTRRLCTSELLRYFGYFKLKCC